MESPTAESDASLTERIRAEFSRLRDSGADDMVALHGTAATLRLSLEDAAATLGLAGELARSGTGWRIERPHGEPPSFRVGVAPPTATTPRQ